jgi:hypothetical protein
MRGCASVTCVPRCTPSTSRPFFIPTVHREPWISGSTGAPLGIEVGSEAMGHVAVMEPTAEAG